MKSEIKTIDGKAKSMMELPKLFESKINKEAIKKAILAFSDRHPYGAFKRAGMEFSAHGIWKHRRRAWKGSYGIGIARTPSKVMSRRGSHFVRMGAFAANTRGGREAHPPKASKIWEGKINKKEKEKALISALILNSSLEILKKTYPKTDFSEIKLPFIIEDKIAEIEKMKDLKKALKNALGKASDLIDKRILFLSEKKIKAKKLAFDIKKVKELNIKDLAPSGEVGRFIIFSESSMKELEKWH